MTTCPTCFADYRSAVTVCPTCTSNLETLERSDAVQRPSRELEGSREARVRGGVRARPTRFEPGTVLGERYRVVNALGRGGMGEVYRADDLELGDSVALKFLPEKVECDERKLEMLLLEARVARTVSHTNVCRVHDIGVHREDGERLHFISMEYIDGETLSSLLRRVGSLSKAKALQLSSELCRSLAAIHDSGLLHCDIKPGNVMIDGQGHVRLADFGLAIAGSRGAARGGTPAYMAPEQVVGCEATVRSDIYALGLVLYEIFTGNKAFRASSPSDYAWLHLQASAAAPSEQVHDLDPRIEALILECLEKIPEQRIDSAEAVAEALARIDPDRSVPDRQLEEQGDVMRTLLKCDLVGRTALIEALGSRWAAELGRRHGFLVRDLVERHEGLEVDSADSFLILFVRPIGALHFALDYHEAIVTLAHADGHELAARVGIHFGEVWLQESSPDDVALGARPIEVEGLAKGVAARLMSMAESGQTLLSRHAFDLARRAAVDFEKASELRWLAHGAWRLFGVADPVDVFEVGREGKAPLQAPAESDAARRLLVQSQIDGWRPALDLVVPGRPHWQLQRRLGEGGFGEVWLARHAKTGERRSFKFCFDAERMKALQREITLFRLLIEELGDRVDISRILDWNLEEAPYFIEAEYSSAGNLAEWVESQGGWSEISLGVRLEIAAQVATALAAAHSVGILHKDVKPSNVLIQPNPDGGFTAQLADFGIGQATEQERLVAAGITILGLSGTTIGETSSSGKRGTRLYMAPELLEGRAPTQQADLYALGVMLYQMVVGDLGRALGPGWRRDIEDPILADDIACFVDRSPGRRPASAIVVAERLRNLDERHRKHEAAAVREAALKTAQRRRRVYQAVAATSLVALVVVSILALWAIRAGQQERQARKATDKILDFLVSVFEVADPFALDESAKQRGETITAREILDRGAERFAAEFADEPLLQGRLMRTYSGIYASLGLYEKAQALDEQALVINQRWHGAEHPNTLDTLHGLGVTLYLKGELARCREVFEQTLEARQRVLGGEHIDTLLTRSNLAATLLALGEYFEAKQLIEKTLEIQTRVLGPEHVDTLGSMGNLANCHYDLGEFREAKQLNQKALEIQTRVLGPEHPLTLDLMGNLANSLGRLGEFRESQHLTEQVLKIQTRVLGAEHPYTLLTMSNLADTRSQLGAYREASRLSARVLEIQTRVLGIEHPETLMVQANLAYNLWRLGDYTEAKRLLEETLEIRTRVLGAEHPETLQAVSALALCLSSLGESGRALRLLEASQAALEQLESDSPVALFSRYALAITLGQLGDLDTAEEHQREVLEVAKESFGERYWLTLDAMRSLGELLSLRGDWSRAKALQEAAYEVHERALGPGHPSIQEVKVQLAENLRRLGEIERAKDLAETARHQLETMLGPRHDLTTRATWGLLEIAREQEDLDAASLWLQKLSWLAESDEGDIDSTVQRAIRQDGFGVLRELDMGVGVLPSSS
ncbi:MAG: tetratricopeptide repeat protein [Acidobacteriota bacterium]